MKIVIQQGEYAETEVIICCTNAASDEVAKIKENLETIEKKIIVSKNCSQSFMDIEKVIYCEYINRKVFVYTAEDMFTTNLSLADLEVQYKPLFRCSKNTIVNVNEISNLKSEISGTILATLSSGEKVFISRHYASKLRKLIKER